MDPKLAVLLVACTRAFFTTGSVKISGVFLDEMTQKLNTTSALVAWALSIQNGVSLITAPVCSVLLEMFPIGSVFVMGSILAGGGYVLCALLTETVAQLFFWFCLSGLGFGLCILPSFLAMEAHHKENFPIMICIVHLFHFIGIAVLPPIFQFLRNFYSLTESLVLYGAIVWNLTSVGFSFPSMPSKMPFNTEDSGRFDPENQSLVKTCRAGSAPSNSDSYNKGKTSYSVKRLIPYLSLFSHKGLIVILVAELVQKGIIFTSWALIVVSYGKSVGLSPGNAVLLSTTCGVGGFLGKLIAVCLCKFNRMNMKTSYMIPCIINGISFISCVYVENFYIISLFMFLIGLGIALNLSGLMSFLPSVVCRSHFKEAAVVMHVASGLGVQAGGLYAGIIYDVTGLAAYVLAMNGILSFLMLLPASIWGFKNAPTKDCTFDDDT